MLLFCDGFDHYINPTDKWDNYQGWGVNSSASSRTAGGQGYASSQNGGLVTQNVSPATTLIAGVAFNHVPGNGASCILLGINNEVAVYIDNNGLVNVALPHNNPGSFASSVSVSAGTWNYVELYAIVGQHNDGTVIVRLNGVDVINMPGVTTSDSPSYTSISLGDGIQGAGGANSHDTWFDDFYVCDNTGTANNNFLGDIKIVTLMPNGPGSSTKFNPVGAATNWQAVSTANPQGDLVYVTDATVGDEDLYTIAPITGSGIVCGVQLSMRARKDDAGSRSINSVVSLEGTTTLSPSPAALGGSYRIYTGQFQVNPATGTAWTYPDINQLEIGVEVSA